MQRNTIKPIGIVLYRTVPVRTLFIAKREHNMNNRRLLPILHAEQLRKAHYDTRLIRAIPVKNTGHGVGRT